jgi:hypothetical protein
MYSGKLWRNMQAADPNVTKAVDEESHHIVAARAEKAKYARGVLFEVGIGINLKSGVKN